MADDKEDRLFIPEPFDYLYKDSPLDLTEERNDPWVNQSTEDILGGFEEVLSLDKQVETLRSAGTNFGRQLDDVFNKDTPIATIPSQTGIFGASLVAPEEKRPPTGIWDNFRRGALEYGNSVTAALRLYNAPYAEELQKKIDETLKNVPQRQEPSFLDAYTKSKDLQDAAQKFGTATKETIGEAFGSSAGPVAGTLALTWMMGKKAFGPALLLANAPASIGEAVRALEEERSRVLSVAQEAESQGNEPLAKAYRAVADQLKPENNLKSVHAVGALITALEASSEVISIFKKVPDNLLADVKRGMYERLAVFIMRRAATGTFSEAATEGIEDFVKDLNVLRTEGLTAWLDAYNQTKRQNYYLESILAGGAGGLGLGTASSAYQAGKTVLGAKLEGSQPKTQEELPEIEVPQGANETATQDETTTPTQQPELTPEFRTALEDYLANPDNTFRKTEYSKLSDTFGIPEESVKDYLEAAAQEGLIRKDPNGKFRRPAARPNQNVAPNVNETAGQSAVMPEAQTIEEEAIQEAGSEQTDVGQPEYIDIPEDLDKQYSDLEAEINADAEKLANIRTSLKNASSKKRQTMNAEREERDALAKKIAEGKKRLESLDELKSERELRAQPPATPVVEGKPVVQRKLPETGKTLLNYLIDSGGITVPGSYAGDTRSIYQKAQSLFGKDVLRIRRLIMKGGRKLDDPALWDDLVAEGFISPYIDPNGGPNLYDVTQRITDFVGEELGGKPVYSSKFDRNETLDPEQEFKAVINKVKDLHDELGIPYNLTPEGEERIVELVLKERLNIDDGLERLAIERGEHAFNNPSAPFKQPAISEKPSGESQGPTVQEGNQGERADNVGAGEVGNETSQAGQADEDVIPFSVLKEQNQKQALRTLNDIQVALNKALKEFKKIAPEGTNIEVFDKTLNNLSTRLNAYIRQAQSKGITVEAAYDPVQDIVALSKYGSDPTSLVTHEAVHALVNNGLVARGQIQKLADESKSLGLFTQEEEAQYRKFYKEANKDVTPKRLKQIIDEEAAARLVQSHVEAKATQSKYQKIIDTIAEFLRLIKRAFSRGLSTKDIVDMILNGDAAKGKLGQYVAKQDLANASQIITASLDAKNVDIASVIRETEKSIAEKPNPEILAALEKKDSNKVLKGINTIIRNLVDGLGITLNQGNALTAKPTLPGLNISPTEVKPQYGYNPETGTIRQRNYYDWQELIANLPAALENKMKWLRDLQMQHSDELAPLDPASMSAQEGFKTFINLYLSDRVIAMQKANKFYDAFEEALEKKNPDYLAALQEAQVAYEDFSMADPVGVVSSFVNLPKDRTKLGQYKKFIKNNGIGPATKYAKLYLYQQFIGPEAPIAAVTRDLVKAVLENTGDRIFLYAHGDPSKIYRMMPHIPQQSNKALLDGIMLPDGTIPAPGLSEILADALGSDSADAIEFTEGSRYHNFTSYLIGLRAKQLWEKYMNEELDRPPLPVAPKIIDRQLAELEQRYPAFKAAQVKYNRMTQALLTYQKQKHIISDKTYQELSKDKFYVPFMRDFEEQVVARFSQGGKPKGQDTSFFFKKLRGSNRNILDPIESLAHNVYSTFMLAGMNDITRHLAKLADMAGPVGGDIVERINPKQVQVELRSFQTALKQVAKDKGLSDADAEALLQSGVAALGPDALFTVFSQKKINTKGKPIIHFMEDGELKAIQVNHEYASLVINAYNALGKDTGFIFKLLSFPTQVIRFTVSMSGAYMAANVLRDMQILPTYNKAMVPGLTQAKGLSLLAQKEWRDKYIRSGAMMGGFATQQLDKLRIDQNIKRLGNLNKKRFYRYENVLQFFHNAQTLMETSETLTRMPLMKDAFLRAKADGLNDSDALFEAGFYANDYMDYSRIGLATRRVSFVLAFLNAALQGTDRMARTMVAAGGDYGKVLAPYLEYHANKALGKNPKPLTTKEKNILGQSFFAWFWMTTVLGGSALLITQINDDDESILDADSWMRATHYLLSGDKAAAFLDKMGLPSLADWMRQLGIDKTTIRPVKAFEYSFAANLIERYVYDKKRGDPNWFANFLGDTLTNIAPPYEPEFMKIRDMIKGTNPFTGREVEPDYMKRLPARDRYTPYTSDLAKKVGKLLDVSPMYVDNMLNSGSANLGRDAKAISKYLSDEEMSVDEYYMARRFLWGVGKNSEDAKRIQEIMGSRDPVFDILGALKQKHERLGTEANGYENILKNQSLAAANERLKELSPRARGLAILQAGTSPKNSKYDRLHPGVRAREMLDLFNNIKRDLSQKTLYLNKGTKNEEKLDISASAARQAAAILTMLQYRESSNALKLIEEPGYVGRKFQNTEPLYKELREVSPELYGELINRFERNHILPFEGVKQVWPQLKETLQSDELYQKAMEGETEYVVELIDGQGLYETAKDFEPEGGSIDQ